MENSIIIEQLSQVKTSELSAIMQKTFRGIVLDMFLSVMDAEVSLLCGTKYHPDSDPDVRRAGSAQGSIILDKEKIPINRPRVRDVHPSGTTSERPLKTYAAARDPEHLKSSILNALCAGVSSRDQSKIHPNSSTSKSQISRLWKQEGKQFIETLRSRDLSTETWVALLVDGIELSSDITAITAMGITLDGRKVILDFQIGSSESYEVCLDLLRRVNHRGFAPNHGYRLYCVIDGSKALRKSVKKMYPETVIQRCQIHKERNVKSYLSRRDWNAASRLFSRLRKQQGGDDANAVYNELKLFVSSKNSAAYDSLLEAGDDLVALQNLGCPSTLNQSLLSTNLIENSYRNVRNKLGRVCRFRSETNQAERWMALALCEAEKGFRRIRGYADLCKLHALLKCPSPSNSGSKVIQGHVPATSPLSPSAQSTGATDGESDEVTGTNLTENHEILLQKKEDRL